MPKPSKKNSIPLPLQNLTLQELYLFCRIPLHLLEGFKQGRFKPIPSDRQKLTKVSMPFYAWNDKERRLFVQRRKYRELRPFISITEKAHLLDQETDDDYDKELNRLLEKYWEEIVAVPVED